MELRTACSPRDMKTYDTARLREEFLIEDLFQPDNVKMVYSHIDRIITGAAVPVTKALTLDAGDELRAEYFLQRRELGIINIGGEGKVTIDGTEYTLRRKDGMYGKSSWRASTPTSPPSSTSTARPLTRPIPPCTSAPRTA